jgi:eukaryotic-like serine/threonine-protein kinase
VELDKVHMSLKESAPVKSITVGAGDVVSQDPKPGVTQKEGSTVTVVVSDGPPDVSVPSLANMTCAQAVPALQNVHLNANCTAGSYDNSVPATIIISWSIGSTPNPTKAPYGSTITIVPSLGHQPATVPSIPNTYTYAQAAAALQAVGLTATQVPAPNATVAVGNVISTDPASGAQAPYGSQVTVTVSTGPPTVQVPDVQGESVQQATAALQAAGLTASGVSGNPVGTVTGTQPSIGSTVDTGSSVQLIAQ